MTTDDEFRKQAADAQAMADKSISPLDREAWLRIARGFLSLIRGAPATETEKFDAEVSKHGTNQKDSTESH